MQSVNKTYFTSDADLPISQIATMLEYDSQNSYTRNFQDQFGVTPLRRIAETKSVQFVQKQKHFFLIIAKKHRIKAIFPQIQF